ncbi:MAG: AMP-binding protein, partial [Actinomycetota bacterium]
MQPPALTIGGIVRHAARSFGAAEGLVEGDRRLSFEDIARAVGAAAKSFRALGLEPGDRVAIWAPNSAAWGIAARG